MTEQDSSASRSQAMHEAAPEDDGVPFGITAIEVLTGLAGRKRLIASVTGAAMLIGLFYGLALPARYTSVTKIMPPKQTQSTNTFLNSQLGSGSLADVAGGGLSLKDPNAIYIGLLKSRPIADAIVDRFGLTQAYKAGDRTAARNELENDTKVVSERSGLISISVTDGNKKRVAEMANAYTEDLRALTKTISVTEASKRRLFFEQQLKDAKDELVEAEVTLQQIQQSNGLVHLDAQASVIVGSLADVRGQIAAKEVELQALRSYSTERNPDVQLAEREVSTLRAEAAQLEQHGSSPEFSELGLKDVPKAGLDYIRAQRELQYRQTFFDLLLKQYEAARLDEAKDAAVIQVVEPAIEPDRKSSPKRMLILLFSTVLGLFSACLLARFLDWAELEISNPESARALRNLQSAFMGRKPAERT